MRLGTILLVGALAYSAYHSHLVRVALDFTDSDPDLPMIDAIFGVVTALVARGDLSRLTRADVHEINRIRENEIMLRKNVEFIFPKAWVACKRSETCTTQRIDITAKSDGRRIPLSLVQHKQNITARKPSRIVLYFHPGGGVLGHAEDYKTFSFPEFYDAMIVSVAYRKAPEHPYPAAVNDGLEALQWVTENADKYVVDAEKITLAGDSGGSLIAAALAQSWKDKNRSPKIHRLVLVIPMLGPVLSRSFVTYENMYMLPMKSVGFFWDMYAPNIYDCVVDPVCSPVSASVARLIGIADEAIIVPARADVLRDEGVEYARKLQLAGVKTKLVLARGTHIGINLFDEVVRSSSYLRD